MRCNETFLSNYIKVYLFPESSDDDDSDDESSEDEKPAAKAKPVKAKAAAPAKKEG